MGRSPKLRNLSQHSGVIAGCGQEPTAITIPSMKVEEMKNSLRLTRVAAVLTALVLVAAACGGGSSNEESGPLAPDTAEPGSLSPNDIGGDTPAIAGVCAPDEPDCIDTVVVGGDEPVPLPVCAPDEPDCIDTVVVSGDEPGSLPTVEPVPPARDAEPVVGPAGIEALQIDGVWVFQHQPEAAMDALHSGTPEIVNGCLVIDNTVVVWHLDRIEDAADVVAAVNAGESPQLLIAGGGLSLAEGASQDQIPSVITDLCPTSAVWFGAP